eukprot:SAG31_NODE_1628_length_7704_cov_27.599606_4_plen_42_part_00
MQCLGKLTRLLMATAALMVNFQSVLFTHGVEVPLVISLHDS